MEAACRGKSDEIDRPTGLYNEFIRSFLTGKGVFLLLAPEQKLQEVNCFAKRKSFASETAVRC